MTWMAWDMMGLSPFPPLSLDVEQTAMETKSYWFGYSL